MCSATLVTFLHQHLHRIQHLLDSNWTIMALHSHYKVLDFRYKRMELSTQGDIRDHQLEGNLKDV